MKKWMKYSLAALTALMLVLAVSVVKSNAADHVLAVGDDGQWHYYTDGNLDTSYRGLASNEYGWWYINNGGIDWNYVGMASNQYGWWYVRGGAIDWGYTGMASNEYGWWYIRNGAIDLGYTGMACNEYGWWYYQNGGLNWTYTGMACNEYGWWYYQNGALNWTYTGMACNEYGWWYYQNGGLDTGYTGIAQNEYGKWVYLGGRLAADYSGRYEYNGVIYIVTKGHAVELTEATTQPATQSPTQTETTQPATQKPTQVETTQPATQKPTQAETTQPATQSPTQTEATTAHVHSYVVVETKTATCTEAGYIKKKCSGCGDIKTETIAATGHKSSDWIVTKEATATEDGERVKKCTVCGEILEREVIKRGSALCSLDSSSPYYKYEYAYRTNDASALTAAEDKKFYEGLKACLDQVYQNTGLYEQEKAAHDWIVLSCAYDYENYLNGTIPYSSYRPVGIFAYRTAVCDGYAQAFQLVMDIIGIPCKKITGTANGGGHAWNAVQLEGDWYMVDTTWDDPVPDTEGKVIYNYFNVTDEMLKQDHSYTSEIKATGTKYFYYTYEGIYFYLTTDGVTQYYKDIAAWAATAKAGDTMEFTVKRMDDQNWSADNWTDYLDATQVSGSGVYWSSCTYSKKNMTVTWEKY